MIELFPVQYYTKIFYWTMFTICLFTGIRYCDSKGCEKLLKQNSAFLPFVFSLLLIAYIGLRPVSWYFGDMPMYQHQWNMREVHSVEFFFDFQSEWFFAFVQRFCKLLVPNVQFWFVVIELFYIGCQFWACKKLLWENVWLAIMFVFFSYQFYTYGVNGIRNGMGTGLMMLAIVFFCDGNKISYILGFLLFVIAFGCHRSVIIPIAAVLVSLFVVKDIKFAVWIWMGCIVLSLFAGSYFQNLFAGLAFDDRMSQYNNTSESTLTHFSHVGFRWDFLLYSAMPVWLAWYVRYKNIYDKNFTLLANTYIIANSFWVLICRVAFSNRFAYLSWFLYALVIAYAAIRVPIWKDQDRKAGQILLFHTSFTMIMFFLGK